MKEHTVWDDTTDILAKSFKSDTPMIQSMHTKKLYFLQLFGKKRDHIFFTNALNHACLPNTVPITSNIKEYEGNMIATYDNL